ncbi:MAG TPA: hypothetical protein VM600_03510, partial [Actinomycetota bacterium]|nr:hypothetical protein [Actinomycetota bacterium]
GGDVGCGGLCADGTEGAGNDVMYGGDGGDLLIGLEGDDQLFGEEDIDIIVGGLGSDQGDGGNPVSPTGNSADDPDGCSSDTEQWVNCARSDQVRSFSVRMERIILLAQFIPTIPPSERVTWAELARGFVFAPAGQNLVAYGL